MRLTKWLVFLAGIYFRSIGTMIWTKCTLTTLCSLSVRTKRGSFRLSPYQRCLIIKRLYFLPRRKSCTSTPETMKKMSFITVERGPRRSPKSDCKRSSWLRLLGFKMMVFRTALNKCLVLGSNSTGILWESLWNRCSTLFSEEATLAIASLERT